MQRLLFCVLLVLCTDGVEVCRVIISLQYSRQKVIIFYYGLILCIVHEEEGK